MDQTWASNMQRIDSVRLSQMNYLSASPESHTYFIFINIISEGVLKSKGTQNLAIIH